MITLLIRTPGHGVDVDALGVEQTRHAFDVHSSHSGDERCVAGDSVDSINFVVFENVTRHGIDVASARGVVKTMLTEERHGLGGAIDAIFSPRTHPFTIRPAH